MTFASEAQKVDNKKSFLAEITGRRYIGVGVSIGGNDYTWTGAVDNLNVTSVFVNGSTSGVTFTVVGNLLTVNSATNLANSSNIVIVQHKIYVTGREHVVTDGSYSLPAAQWEPRMLEFPTFFQSMRNIADGVFSISSSSLVLLSDNGWANKYLGENDSLSNGDVKIWMTINGISNNRLVYNGQVRSLKYEANKLIVEITDTFNLLSTTASFGNRINSRNYYGHPDRPYINAGDENTVAPITIGYSSQVEFARGWRHLDAYGTPNAETYHCKDGIRAIKVSPQNPGTNDPVTFYAGRMLASDLKKVNFGTIQATYQQYVNRLIPSDPEFRAATTFETISIRERIIYLQTTAQDCEIGDYIPELEGYVCAYGNNIWGGADIAIAVPIFGFTETEYNATGVSGLISNPSIANNTHPSMSVWIEGGEQVEYKHIYIPAALNPDLGFTQHGTRYLPFTVDLSNSYTYAGQTVTDVYFTIDPVAAGLVNDGGESTVNPLASATIKCRFKPATETTHANALKFIIESSGMTTNSASFTQADSDLSAIVSMTLPFNQSTEFGSYLEAAQAITSSTLGILRLNDDLEVEYLVLRNPLTATTDRDTTDMLEGETSTSIEYQDIHASIKFENEQLKVLNIGEANSDYYYDDNLISVLHKNSKVKEFKHVLKDITNIIDPIKGYHANPTVEYNFATASKDLSTNLGDVIDVTNKVCANVSEQSTAVVVSIDTSAEKTSIRLNEIRGV